MDIFDYALQMEKDGERFYREIAQKTSIRGLQTILTMLANEEVRHYRAIERMKQDNYQITESAILDDAMNIFSEMEVRDERFEGVQEQTGLYAKAQEIEKKSQQFYLDKARETDKHGQAELFERLAKEQEKHYFLLQEIIDFISRPEQWLENAEWHHLEDY